MRIREDRMTMSTAQVLATDLSPIAMSLSISERSPAETRA